MSTTAFDSGEATFGFDELFFSRTDEAGIIKFGNSVFQRVSVYSWEELLSKPHKIVRHPDTPRAVFWLLWDTIKRGAPIGAYVKNKAKDGRYYWVFAIVTPVKGGYLSVRLRPSSEFFNIVKQAYPALAAQEKSDGIAPAESAALLLGQLKGLGFNDYAGFMAAALGKELAARDAQLGRQTDETIKQFDKLLVSANSLLKHADRIAGAYELNQIVPTNFRILASQLGQDGAAIGVISNNYAMLSAEMKLILDSFVASANDVVRAINDGYFLVSTARVQREVLDFFQSETGVGGAGREQEMLLLGQQQAAYMARAKAGLLDIAHKADGFRQSCLDMSRLATGLEVMRVIGKVECSRHAAVKDRVDKLLSDLEMFQRTISGALREIAHVNRQIHEETETLIARAAA
ncbi:MAG: PAS domain-containing protein [Parvularculaceae bacterium]